MPGKKDAQAEASFPPGLVNTSNTCFFNSVMQCFIASSILEATVESLAPSLPSSIDPARSPALTDIRRADGQAEQEEAMPISDAYLAFLERSWSVRNSADKKALSPRDVLSRLGAKYDQYLDFRQQDAHELYCHLLDAMHMEEFDVIKKRQPPPPKPNKKARREGLNSSAHGSRFHMTRTGSTDLVSLPAAIPEEEKLRPFVDQVFGGTLASMVVCETCRHVSHTYEDFTDLSLSIKSDDAKSRKRDRLKSISQLFRLPARSSPRHQSLPQDNLIRDLTDAEETSESNDANALPVDPEPVPVPSPPVDKPLTNGLLLGGSNAEGKKMTKRLSLRWGKTKPKGRDSEREPDRSAPPSDIDARTGDERESDADWEQVRRSLESKKTAVVRPPESGHTSDAEGPVDQVVRKPTLKRPNALHAHSRTKLSSSTIKPFRPPHDEAAYIRRILADTAPVAVSAQGSPLSLLRVSNPAAPASSGSQAQTSWLKLGGAGHGLVDCLRQFTSVEVLEGDNAFACRRCWKIQHTVGGKRKSEDRDEDDDEDEDDEDHVDHMPDGEPENDLVVVTRPSSPSVVGNGSLPSPVERAGSDDSPMLSVPSRPPSVISQSAISIASSGDDLAASIVSSPSTFPEQHFRNVDEDRPTSPTSAFPSSFYIPRANTSSPDHSVSPTITDPSTPQPIGSHNPFLIPGFGRAGRANHFRSPLSDAESSLMSEESDYIESEAPPSASASEMGSRPPSPPAVPRLPTIPRSQQVIHRRALKRYLISTSPPILVIHLKRFEQLSKSSSAFFGNLKKIEDFVSFPEYLDMGPFMAPNREDYGLRRHRGRRMPAPPQRREDEPLTYRLYGIVVHIGSMLGGHYIAYTALPSQETAAVVSLGASSENPPSLQSNSPAKKTDRQWCYISDTTVRPASIDEVLKAKAYLCFYERMYN